MKHKTLRYETYVRLAVLYPTETMTWKKELFQRMEVFQNHFLPWMTRCRQIDRMLTATENQHQANVEPRHRKKTEVVRPREAQQTTCQGVFCKYGGRQTKAWSPLSTLAHCELYTTILLNTATPALPISDKRQ